jgi:CDP-2,3-bis-(O-geranylgeranyl)-sn-glycerol synthase
MLELLLLIFVANSAPVLAADLLDGRWEQPIDAGLRLRDGRPLLGRSKTWRGLVAALAATTLAALPLGLHWGIGLGAAALSMSGDLLASFGKRRLGYAPSDRAPLLDSIPESLVPALGLRAALGLEWLEVVGVVALFAIAVRLISPLLYRLHIRGRPW